MRGSRNFTDGFAAPILWGVAQLYSIPEIAQGLGLEVATVCAVIESRSAVRFPPRMLLFGLPRAESVLKRTGPARVDPDRLDEPAYAAWARARVGATRTVEARGPQSGWASGASAGPVGQSVGQ